MKMHFHLKNRLFRDRMEQWCSSGNDKEKLNAKKGENYLFFFFFDQMSKVSKTLTDKNIVQGECLNNAPWIHSTSIFRLCFIVISKFKFERLFSFWIINNNIHWICFWMSWRIHVPRVRYHILHRSEFISTQHHKTALLYVQTDRCRSRLWGKIMKENCLKISHHLRKRSTRPKECLQINMVVTVGQQLRQSAGADVAIYHRIRYTIPQYTIY